MMGGNKKSDSENANRFFLLLCSEKLLSDAQLFLCNDGTVAVDVDFDEVVEQTTTFTNQHFKSSFSAMIFMI